MSSTQTILPLLLLFTLASCGSQVVEFPLDAGDGAALDVGEMDGAVDGNGDSGAADAADGADAADDAADVDGAADDADADADPDAPVVVTPTVVTTVPVNGATGVALATTISATFSESMDAATLSVLTFTVQQGTTPVLGTVSFDATTATATFLPTAVLQHSLVYVCTITTGAKSATNVALASDYVWAFTTTAAPTAPPTVESTIPLNDALAVPTATKVTATFSKSMDPLTITDLTFFVKQGTTAVAGAVTFDAATDTAMFTPASALATGLIYTVTITAGATDATGLAMAADYSWIFTTTAAAAVPPTVTATSPSDKAVAVSTATLLTATFSKAMNALTVNDKTFLVDHDGTAVSGSVSLDPVTDVATFLPDLALDPGVVYTATITTGVTDVAGNALAATVVWSFTTAAVVLVAPQVQATTPLDAAIDAAIGSKPTAQFTEPMDPLTLTTLTFTLSQGANPVAGVVTYDAASQTATFAPSAALAAGLPYSATITTVATGLNGLALAADYGWEFTVVGLPAGPPAVDSTFPLDAAVEVLVGTKPSASFSKAMDPLTITTLTFFVEQDGNAVPGTVSLDAATHTAVFAPTAPLKSGLLYTATIATGAKDLGGLALVAPYSWSFSVATLPKVTATTPLNNASKVGAGAQPSATFNRMMDPLTLTKLTFTCKQGANLVAGVVTYQSATKTATFKPTLALGHGLLYVCAITTDAKDLLGQQPAALHEWSFSTSETAPTVLSTNPLNQATNVAINKRPTATFSKAMDPLTLTSLTFTLRKGTLEIAGKVTFDGPTKTATFTPNDALVVGKLYTATITSGAKDTGGTALEADHVWTFSTSVCGQAPISLGAAGKFAILGGATVTNTGPTSVTGDLGVSPGTAVTGFPPGAVVGDIHAGDTAAAIAIANLTTAYNDAAGRTLCPVSVAGNLGGMTLGPGLYKSTSSLAVSSGDLTLDAKGDSDAVFIFQAASTLTTTSGRQVVLVNGAKAANVFWQVGTSATIGSTSAFVGTIMADQAITLKTGATLTGRALARIAAVAMDANTVVLPAP